MKQIFKHSIIALMIVIAIYTSYLVVNDIITNLDNSLTVNNIIYTITSGGIFYISYNYIRRNFFKK